LTAGVAPAILAHVATPTLPLWHAYVDECGDRGWGLRPINPTPATNKGASGLFAATAVLLPDGAQSAALAAWDQATLDIGRPAGTPIHWTNVRSHSHRRHLVRTVAAQTDLTTITVALCKHHLPNAAAIRNASYLYNWTLRLLLERISWFAKDRHAEMTLTFSQIKGITPTTINDYLALLLTSGTNIEWKHLRLPAKIDTPPRRRMLQLADTSSGAVYKALEPDEFGLTERVYLDDLKPRIWRRYRTHSLVRSGFKLGPWPDPAEEAHVPWFSAFCAP
jgi:hypothetical protein